MEKRRKVSIVVVQFYHSMVEILLFFSSQNSSQMHHHTLVYSKTRGKKHLNREILNLTTDNNYTISFITNLP